MSNQAPASSATEPSPAPDDYEAIHAAITQSARGRWFLAELVRRNRNADTLMILSAIERLETLIGEGRQGGPGLQGDPRQSEPQQSGGAESCGAAAQSPGLAETAAAADVPAGDIAAAAERIGEAASTLRRSRLDPAACEQIEALASAIRSVPRLRAGGHRSQELREALRHLERRIEAMLAASLETSVMTGPGPASPVYRTCGDSLVPSSGRPELGASHALAAVDTDVDAHDKRGHDEEKTGHANALGARPRSGAAATLAALKAMSDAERIAMFS
jgi:hypothetical protein